MRKMKEEDMKSIEMAERETMEREMIERDHILAGRRDRASIAEFK